MQDSREISIENRNPSPVVGANVVKSSKHDAHLLNGGSVRWLVILEQVVTAPLERVDRDSGECLMLRISWRIVNVAFSMEMPV